jgi:uncharacterized protein
MISNEIEVKKCVHWKFLGTLLWGCAIFLFVELFSIILTILFKASDYSEVAISAIVKNIGKNGTLLSISAIVGMLLGSLAIVTVIKFKKKSNLVDYLAFKKVEYKSLFSWIGLLLGYVILADAVGLLFDRPIVNEFMLINYKTATPIWLLWFALIIAAPIFEELFFRGFLFKGFVTSPIGAVGTIILTSAVWAIIHTQYGYVDVGIIFFMGILLGCARFKSDSILVPIAMHSIANLLATIEVAIL